ncbi:NAD kinase [Microaerobacter geothermalis]|uniref:NAD kinase n=1 Tax=Microaerobacter geothermalis TaxID=674972 RepID=UPI001EFF114C|nr:NAD kinase [Microaerobacter geothermalis]MCF6093295.1 NAD kinase [Microaerobacter geothermalis]
MKRFFIISRGDQASHEVVIHIRQELQKNGWQEDNQHPELVFSVGGDGTLLEAFHHFTHCLDQTVFLGVHTGKLGFYTDWRPHEVDFLLERVLKDSYEVVTYPLLELNIMGNKGNERYLALNECTIKSPVKTFVVGIEINGEEFEQFRGDGLCLSTPSGSTAYNKSVGGAIIHPSLESFQLAEIASINNRVFRTIGSPIIFPHHHVCDLIPRTDSHDFFITIDHLTVHSNEVNKLRFRVAPEKVRFARYRKFPFWTRVKESFIQESVD